MKKNLIIATLVLLLLASAALAAGPHALADIVDIASEISIGGGSYLTSSNQSGSGGYLVMTNASAPVMGECLVGNSSQWQAMVCPSSTGISGSLASDFSITAAGASSSSTQTLKSFNFVAGAESANNAAWHYVAGGTIIALNSAETVDLCWTMTTTGAYSQCLTSILEVQISDGTHTIWNWDLFVQCGTLSATTNCQLRLSYSSGLGGLATATVITENFCNPTGSACANGINTSGALFVGMAAQFSTASTSNIAYQSMQVITQDH
jgi:hypothetical protein